MLKDKSPQTPQESVYDSCPNCAALRARIEDTEGIAIALAGGIKCWEFIRGNPRQGYRNDALAVQKFLKEGK